MISELIGNTPLKKSKYLSEIFNTNVYLKLEYLNPTNSIKDRPAYWMLKNVKDNFSKTKTIIESTSGNMGISIASFAKEFDFKTHLIINDYQSEEKINLLKRIADNVWVCDEEFYRLADSDYYNIGYSLEKEIPNSKYINQYSNPINPQCHYNTTAVEIWKQTDSKITHFICGVGTGGTISGVGRYLKEKNQNIKVFAVDSTASKYYKEFDENRVISNDSTSINEKIDSLGGEQIPKNFYKEVVDKLILISLDEAYESFNDFFSQEGIMSGYSGSACIAAIKKIKDKINRDSVVVVIIPDSLERYISKF